MGGGAACVIGVAPDDVIGEGIATGGKIEEGAIEGVVNEDAVEGASAAQLFPTEPI